MDNWDPFVKRVKDRFDALYGSKGAKHATSTYPSWKDFFPRAPGIEEIRAYDAEAIRCTAATYKRAIVILNVTCKAARSRGFDISMGHRCTRIDLSRNGAASGLRIVEPSFRTNTSLLSEAERRSISGVGTVGTGWLELLLNENSDAPLRFKEKSSTDGLIERLPEMMSKLETSHAVMVAFWEKRRRSDLAFQAAHVERQKADRELAAERVRRDMLIESAQKWNVARVVREYVVAVEQTSRRRIQPHRLNTAVGAIGHSASQTTSNRARSSRHNPATMARVRDELMSLRDSTTKFSSCPMASGCKHKPCTWLATSACLP
ncbi:hypothetical protein AB4Y45_40950 [Paraburkholderia sp. EG287A]|uniref:hypothetical protein n=1 Tax=unclassified Paraburkholderia TaxID=2615204 RepID=UPI0034D273BA